MPATDDLGTGVGHLDQATGPAGSAGHRFRTMLVAALFVVLVLIAAVSVLEFLNAPSTSSPFTTTSYSVTPAGVINSAVEANQAGYALESSKEGLMGEGAQGAAWALLGNRDGSVANLTVFVFSTGNATLSYFSRLVASAKGLPGYTDVSSGLSLYQQYGRCYAYGEDVDGIAVVNGVCTKGNVFLQAHLVSSVTFQQLADDMKSLMGSLYSSVV